MTVLPVLSQSCLCRLSEQQSEGLTQTSTQPSSSLQQRSRSYKQPCRSKKPLCH